MSPRLLLSICTAAAIACAAPDAAAQSDADRATARQLSKEAHRAYDRKDYATAAERFARAAGIVPAPTLWLGYARAQAELGRLVSAQETYRKIAREGVAKGSPKSWFAALKSAEKEVAALEPRVPFVVIEVKGPSATKVTIDGAEVPALALGVDRPVDPGVHAVRAQADGFAAAEKTVKVAEGGRETVSLELTPLPPPAPPPPPPEPLSTAAAPARVGPESTAAPSGGTQRTLGYAALGVGAAGLVVGGVTGVLFFKQRGTLNDACSLEGGRCPPSAREDVGRYHLYGNLSAVGLVTGGVLAAGGAALLLTAPRTPSAQGAGLSAAIGPGYAGLRGSF